MPTGVLGGLATTEAEQNAHLLADLRAADGVSYLPHGTVANQLATRLSASRAVGANGYPLYGVHEFPPPVGKIPPHRSDASAFLLADAYETAQPVYVKDVAEVPDGSAGGTNGFGTRIAAVSYSAESERNRPSIRLCWSRRRARSRSSTGSFPGT
jgi:molybdenum storage protein